MKWSPDVVSRSAKWCEMKVRDGAIRQRVSGVRDRAKVRRREDRAERNDETSQT